MSEGGSSGGKVSYIIGLGGAGSSIISEYASLNRGGIGVPSSREAQEGVGRARLTSFVEIIDMVLEDPVKLLIDDGILKKGDDVIIGGEILPADAYDHRIIRDDFGRFYMPSLIKYFPIMRSQIRLQKGGGASRFRPLARYYIYYGSGSYTWPLLEKLAYDVSKDFEEKIRFMNAREINIAYTLSLGGGFGSGSLLDIHGVVQAAAKTYNIRIANTFFNLLLPVGYMSSPSPADLVLGDYDESRASAAASLLELLYVLNRDILGKPGYTDKLVKRIGETMGRPGTFSIELTEPKIFVATYKGVAGATINEVYKQVDEAAASLLTAISHIISEKTMDSQEWQIRFPGITDVLKLAKYLGISGKECLEYAGKAPALLYPVAVYNAKVIKLDLRGIVPSDLPNSVESLARINEELSELEGRKAELENQKEKHEKEAVRIGELKKDLEGGKAVSLELEEAKDLRNNLKQLEEALKEVLSSIQEEGEDWRNARRSMVEASRLWVDIRREISRLVSQIQEGYLGGVSRGYVKETSRLAQRLEGAETAEELGEIIGDIVGREYVHGRLSLLAYHAALEEIWGQLRDLAALLGSIEDNLNTIRVRARNACGVFANLLKKDQCRVSSIAEDLRSDLGKSISNVERIKNTINMVLDPVSSLIFNANKKLAGKLAEINGQLHKLEETIGKMNAQIEDLRNKLKYSEDALNKSREQLYKNVRRNNPFLPSKTASRLADDIIEGIRSGGIEVEGGELKIRDSRFRQITTINGIVNRYEEEKELLIQNIIYELVNFISGQGKPLAEYDTGVLEREGAREAGLTTTQDVYLMSSADEEPIFKEIIGRVEGAGHRSMHISSKVLSHVEGSYLAAVIVHYGIPLISIREVRSLLRSYGEKAERQILEIEPVMDPEGREVRLYRPSGNIAVNLENKGEMYHTISPMINEEFKEFVDNAIKLLQCYEESGLIQG